MDTEIWYEGFIQQQLARIFWSYLSHFKSDFDSVKSKIGILNSYNPLASRQEMLWVALICLAISQNFKSDLDGVKSKVGPLN